MYSRVAWWQRIIASGQEPCSRPERDAGVAGVVDAPLPLDQHHVGVLGPSSVSHSAAPAMKSATTASTAMPQPSIMIPVCPVGTKRVRMPRSLSFLVS